MPPQKICHTWAVIVGAAGEIMVVNVMLYGRRVCGKCKKTPLVFVTRLKTTLPRTTPHASPGGFLELGGRPKSTTPEKS